MTLQSARRKKPVTWLRPLMHSMWAENPGSWAFEAQSSDLFETHSKQMHAFPFFGKIMCPLWYFDLYKPAILRATLFLPTEGLPTLGFWIIRLSVHACKCSLICLLFFLTCMDKHLPVFSFTTKIHPLTSFKESIDSTGHLTCHCSVLSIMKSSSYKLITIDGLEGWYLACFWVKCQFCRGLGGWGGLGFPGPSVIEVAQEGDGGGHMTQQGVVSRQRDLAAWTKLHPIPCHAWRHWNRTAQEIFSYMALKCFLCVWKWLKSKATEVY